MKFRKIQETHGPRAGDEKKFVRKHVVDVLDDPQMPDPEVKDQTKKSPRKKKRLADRSGVQADASVYESAIAAVVDEARKIAKRGSVISKQDRDELRRERMRAMRADEDDDGSDETGEEADDNTNIVMQLRKAVSMRGQKEVVFNDGSKKKVPAELAQRALVKYNKARTSKDKDYVARGLAKSPASFNATIAAVKEAKLYDQENGLNLKRGRKNLDKESARKKKELDAVDESLIESLKAGPMKLKDGTSVRLSDTDVERLGYLFDDLSSSNRKKMENTLMGSKKGFDDIMTFAKELD